MNLITYRGRPMAMAGRERFQLAPQIVQRPDGDPLKTFVCFLVLYARDVLCGGLPGEPPRYLPARAERYARECLIPSRAFLARAERSDAELARHFAVPPEQITQRRAELHAHDPGRSRPPRQLISGVARLARRMPESTRDRAQVRRRSYSSGLVEWLRRDEVERGAVAVGVVSGFAGGGHSQVVGAQQPERVVEQAGVDGADRPLAIAHAGGIAELLGPSTPTRSPSQFRISWVRGPVDSERSV